MPDDIPTPSVDTQAIRMVTESGAVPFLDVAGIARIHRKPGDAKEPDNEKQICWPVQSQRIRAWVAKIFYEQTQNMIHQRALDRVLLCLEGMAEDNDDCDAELCDLIDIDPLLGVLIRYVRFQRYVKLTAADLLEQLNQFTADDPIVRSVNWPRSPESMGLRLRKLIDWLSKAGIFTEFQRDNRNRWIVMRDGYDGSETQLSQQSSQVETDKNADLRPHDTCDSSPPLDPQSQFDRIQKGLSP